MTELLWVAAFACVALGIAGLILPALPGPLLIFAGLVAAAWAEDFAFVGANTLIVLGILAALAFVLDLMAGALGARRYGASTRAAAGALLGALVGMFFGLPGLVFGPFLGAVAGQFLAAPELRLAVRAGWGAWIGVLLGTAAKVALAALMIGLFIFVRFF